MALNTTKVAPDCSYETWCLGVVYDSDERAAGASHNGTVYAAFELLTVVGEVPESELAGRHEA